MKNSISILYIFFGLFLVTSQTQAQSDEATINDYTGTWKYTSQEAPYAYQHGQFIISEKDEEPAVNVVFSNDRKLQGRNIEIKDQQLHFNLYVENEYVTIKVKRQDEKIIGSANTSQGDIALTATAVKEE